MSPRRRHASAAARATLVMLAAASLLAGCFTGKRPSFSTNKFDKGTPTGDAQIDAVLAKLDATTTGPLTADYTVLTKFGNVTHNATVRLFGQQRAVIIGDVEYLQVPQAPLTCTISTATCTGGFDATRVSDVGVTVDFYATEAAKRLRRDAQSRLGPTVTRQETIAGQPATCVDVILSGGTAVYCVLADGIVGRFDDGDVLVTMTTFQPAVAADAFSPPATPPG